MSAAADAATMDIPGSRSSRREARTVLHLLVVLVVLASVVIRVAGLPLAVLARVGMWAGVAIAVSTAARRGAGRRIVRPSLAQVDALALIAVSFAITALAVHAFPRAVDRATVYAVHLRPVCLLVHGLFVAAVCTALWRGYPLSDVGLIGLAAHTAVNGRVFQVVDLSMSLVWGMIAVTALAWHGEGRRPRFGLLEKFVLAFMAWAAAASAFSVYPHASVEVTSRLWAWGAVCLLASAVPSDASRHRRMIIALIVCGAGVAGAALPGVVAYARAVDWSHAVRARLGIGNMHANGVAAVTAATLVMAAGGAWAWKGLTRAVCLVSVVPMVTALALTSSRSAAIGGAAGAAVLALGMRRRGCTPRASRVTVRWLAMILAGMALCFTVLRPSQGEFSSRIAIWSSTIRIIQKRAVTGIGPGNHLPAAFVTGFSEPFLRLDDPVPLKDFLTATRTAGWHPHNVILEIGEATGIPGVLLFLAMLGTALVPCRGLIASPRGPALLILASGLSALLVAQMGESCIGANSLLPVEFLLLLGLMASARAREIVEQEATLARSSPAPLLATLILLSSLVFSLRAALAESTAASPRLPRARPREASTTEGLNWAYRFRPLDAEFCATMADGMSGEEAVAWWRRAVARRQWHAPYRTRLAWGLWSQGDFAGAQEEFHRAAVLDPLGLDGGSPCADEAIMLAAMGREEDAIRRFEDAALFDATSLAAPDWCRANDRVVFNGAYARYAAVRRADDDLQCLINAHVRSGMEHCKAPCDGDLTLDAVVDPLVEAHVDTIWLRYRLLTAIMVNEHWGRHHHVLDLLDRLHAITPPGTFAEARIMAKRSRALAHLGQYQLALKEARAAVRTSGHPVFRHRLGALYMRRKRFDHAIPEFERAAASWDPRAYFDPAWPRYWVDLGDACVGAGRFDDAIRAFDVARFLGLQPAAYVERMNVIIRSATGKLDVQTRAFQRVVRGVSSMPGLAGAICEVLESLSLEIARAGLFAEVSPGDAIEALRGDVPLDHPLREKLVQSLEAARRAVRAS